MEQIPRDVADAVRATAQAAKGYAGDLDDVRERARRHRKRQAAGAFAGVVVVLTAIGAGIGAWREPAPSATPTAATSQVVAPRAEPAQRLLLDGVAGSYRAAGSPVTLDGRELVGELAPDGRLITHDVVGADGWDRFVGLPGGGLVALGAHDTMPGTDREDGTGVAGLEINLVVVGADGAVRLERDVRHPGEAVSLLTATGTTAYLWRPAGLVAHDLGSGQERVLLPPATLDVRTNLFDGSLQAADLAGDRLVLAAQRDSCVPRVFDTAARAAVVSLPLSGAGCRRVTALRLSPDGAVLAAAYESSAVEHGFRIALIRVADGTVMADRAVAGTERKVQAKAGPQVIIAWQDDRTLRAVAVPVASGTHDLKPFTVSVG
ncbi:hypothetical protein GCM10010168_09300 [Actinoplanes ianthinogenes]|uniref:Uncharacterized protein n=1 Tax=Actinoplanes ianthinogenes TaxID=122358 RepID=A0ABM7LXR7_9ACTN|nr:hypothetical protein [Actinoplanes ianthinogenes]BCJ44117.1 hypothetical protein Aiant_47740 [Actinoplanes ianthinogenes]GGQ95904.1 hypothetical protein GCM10010168_09300 [Actinoplanes ianthinogenes]